MYRPDVRNISLKISLDFAKGSCREVSSKNNTWTFIETILKSSAILNWVKFLIWKQIWNGKNWGSPELDWLHSEKNIWYLKT